MEFGKRVTASVPLMKELRCMVGKLDIVEDAEKFYLPVYATRKLIRLLPEIIAMPSKSFNGYIYIVTTQALFDTDDVRRSIAEADIQLVKFTEVTPETYRACLVYTISLKIAPLWNAIGTNGFYLQGKDFLTSPLRPIDGVKLTITVTEQETRLFVKSARINLPPLTLRHFGLHTRIIEQFMENDNCVINFGPPSKWKWVYILPSMKRGRVMKATRRIAQNSPIKTYGELKEHWRNMYDYRLPETEDGMIYFQLWFPWAQDGWSYPYHCLSPIAPVKFRLDDFRLTARPFLEDIFHKIDTVCGNELTFDEAR